MKHTILITGQNQLTKEELFAHLWSSFECFTCSASNEDIRNHLHHFVPDVMIYCLQNEEQSGMHPILELKETLESNPLILVIVGTKEDCHFLNDHAPNLAKFVFEKPVNPDMISEYLFKYLEQRDIDSILKEIGTAGKHKRVMVIDDDPFMQRLMTEYLKNDYNVDAVSSGHEAMMHLMEKPADIILLDYEMPDVSGPEVLSQLHQNEATRDIPVIFLTSMTHKEKIEKALLLKPQGYLLKPVNRDKLMEAIKNLIG